MSKIMNIVAIGKTGKGKSSTLNSMIRFSKEYETGQIDGNYFESCDGPDSVSKDVCACEISINGSECRLVDTVGLFDTDSTSHSQQNFDLDNLPQLDQEHKSVLDSLPSIFQKCPEGIDAFLFVVNGSDRASPENLDTINVIFRHLGTRMLDYVIFIVTGKDTSKHTDFQGWKKYISQTLEEGGYQAAKIKDLFIYVDNKNPTKGQSMDILSMIMDIRDQNHGLTYSLPSFNEAQAAAEQEIRQFTENMQSEHKAKIDQDLKRANFKLLIQQIDVQLQNNRIRQDIRTMRQENDQQRIQASRNLVNLQHDHEEGVHRLQDQFHTNLANAESRWRQASEAQRAQQNAVVNQLSQQLAQMNR